VSAALGGPIKEYEPVAVPDSGVILDALDWLVNKCVLAAQRNAPPVFMVSSRASDRDCNGLRSVCQVGSTVFSVASGAFSFLVAGSPFS
jgi:hypothetical protein